MLRYLYAADLENFPTLRDTMFRDRANQFRDRLGWEVSVDENGFERDEYDDLNPLYVIWERADGTHGGSMRFLPTTARTMVNDHFTHLTDGVEIRSPLIWECTRFCLAPDADRRVSAGLVLGADEVMRNMCLEHFVGVYDIRMTRIYAMLGIDLTILGTKGEGNEAINVGLLELTPEFRPKVLARAGVTEEQSRAWFRLAFEPAVTMPVSSPAEAKTTQFAVA